MAKRTRAERKAARKAAAEAEAQARAVHAVRQRRLRIVALVVPLLTAALVVGLALLTGDGQLAGLLAFAGVGAEMLVLLALLGGGVKAQSRDRAGAIDFGQRR